MSKLSGSPLPFPRWYGPMTFSYWESPFAGCRGVLGPVGHCDGFVPSRLTSSETPSPPSHPSSSSGPSFHPPSPSASPAWPKRSLAAAAGCKHSHGDHIPSFLCPPVSPSPPSHITADVGRVITLSPRTKQTPPVFPSSRLLHA